MQPQFFKSEDEKELKIYTAGSGVIDTLGMQKDLFFEECFDNFILGEILFDSDRSPLANAIPRDIFRKSFTAIYDSFLVAGSFESYLETFRNIFGESVEVTFTVPAAGKLQIGIVAQDVELETFIARSIVGNEYVLDNVTDDLDDEIVFQSIKGFETQYELEQMLFEMVPAGIFTDIDLTLGGS